MSEANFAARLREARAGRHLSQRALGAKVGLGHPIILRIEAGTRHVILDEAIAIANALDVPLIRMLTDEPITAEVTLT